MSPKKKKKGKGKIKINIWYFILFLALLFLASAYFSFRAFSGERANHSGENDAVPSHVKALSPSAVSKPKPLNLAEHGERKDGIPRVAIVMDDLGPNRKAILPLLEMNGSITLSILPHQIYSAWIAEEGKRRGLEVIAHIPMEARDGHNPGKGGLYTWMTDDDIRMILEEDLESLPHIVGVSNHMGSAFTEDTRAMGVLMSVLKDRGHFFLDSLTTAKSAGYKTAGIHGIRTFARDIFLDAMDTPEAIEIQWNKLIKRARKQGYAIAIVHPRKNSIEFLEKVLSRNEVEVVPLSEIKGIREKAEGATQRAPGTAHMSPHKNKKLIADQRS